MSFKKDINNTHDKSYKDLFSTKDTFLSLVSTFIQGEWVDKLEKNSMVFLITTQKKLKIYLKKQ